MSLLPDSCRQITWASIWGPGVGPSRSRGKPRAGGQGGRGPTPGTSGSSCEDPEVERAPKQQKETALLRGPVPHLLRPPVTSQRQEQGLWGPSASIPTGLDPRVGWGPRLTPLYWPVSSQNLFLHASLLELAPPAPPAWGKTHRLLKQAEEQLSKGTEKVRKNRGASGRTPSNLAKKK